MSSLSSSGGKSSLDAHTVRRSDTRKNNDCSNILHLWHSGVALLLWRREKAGVVMVGREWSNGSSWYHCEAKNNHRVFFIAF